MLKQFTYTGKFVIKQIKVKFKFALLVLFQAIRYDNSNKECEICVMEVVIILGGWFVVSILLPNLWPTHVLTSL